jgi:hypothetical protein
MNSLHLGFDNEVELPKTGGWLSISDELPDVRNAKVFDPLEHSFNPLAEMDYRKACDVVDIFDALFDRGNSTLTKDEGLELIAEWLEEEPKSLECLVAPLKKGEKPTPGYLWARRKVARVLRSPVLRRVLCNPNNITFAPLAKPKAEIGARINRAELGDFDALVLGLFLMAQYHGQIIVPVGGFYLRDSHVRFVSEGRLICGAHSLMVLPGRC